MTDSLRDNLPAKETDITPCLHITVWPSRAFSSGSQRRRSLSLPVLTLIFPALLPCPPPPRPFASVRFDPLAWSSGSDQRRISGCGIRWLLAGPDSLPLWLCRVCAFVLLRCFSCSHTVLPKEHSLGVIFFSSLSSCKCCIFLQFYLHFTTDYTCMIVYVTNNKEPWTLNQVELRDP